MDKKESEIISLNKLKKFYPGCPKGVITESERPDFLVKNHNSTIGIEIVRLFQHNSTKQIETIAMENSQDYIVQETRKICESMNIAPLEVHIFFGNCPDIVRVNKKEIALQLAQSIINNLPPREEIAKVINDFEGNIPDVIHSFSIVNYSCLSRHHWSIPRAGFVQEDFIKELQLTIDTKNAKYNDYLDSCDECWLIIDAPGNTPSSFFDPTDKTKNNIYRSYFSKTFFVSGFLENYVELKTEN